MLAHGSLPFCQWLSDSSTSSKQTPSRASCIHQKMPLTRCAYLTWKESIIPVQNGGCCVVSWESPHKQTHSVKMCTCVKGELFWLWKGIAFPYVFHFREMKLKTLASYLWPDFWSFYNKLDKTKCWRVTVGTKNISLYIYFFLIIKLMVTARGGALRFLIIPLGELYTDICENTADKLCFENSYVAWDILYTWGNLL